MLNYRLLPSEEWNRLKGLLGNMALPDPEAAIAAVAETEEGDLAGVFFVQIALHMEPLVVNPTFSEELDLQKLHEVLKEEGEMDCTPHYTFSSSPEAGKACKLMGMKQLPFRVWFSGPAPAVEEAP